MSGLGEDVASWLDAEADVLSILDAPRRRRARRAYAALQSASRNTRAQATRTLREIVDGYFSEPEGARYPGPAVTADEWDWGRPGSFEDWELLEGV